MDNKTLEKVTKEPVRQERGRESHQTYMKSVKEQILEDNLLSTSSICNSTWSTSFSTSNSTSSTPSSTSFYAVGSNGAYYVVGMVAILGIGAACVFCAYKKKARQVSLHEKQKQGQPPKRRHML